jgi:hypothetical protein
MWHCDPIDKELARVKMIKTQRETFRYKRLKGEKLTPEEELQIERILEEHIRHPIYETK